MSEGEQKGRLRREITAAYEGRAVTPDQSDWLMYDAIDRLAADVAAVKAKVDAVSPDDVKHFVEAEKAWVTLVEEQRDAAIRERDAATRQLDQARRDLDGAIRGNTRLTNDVAALRDRLRASVAEVERLRAELDDREQTEQVKRLREENEILHSASLNYIHDRDQYRRERDEARAEVERLKADDKQAPDDLGVLQDARGLSERCKELASRIAMQKIESQAEKLLAESSQQQPSAAPQPDGNSPGTLDSSPAAPQPAAPPPGWLTDEERRVLQNHAESLREQRFALERGGQAIGYSVNPGLLKREADLIDAILARAGSPPVVEVPALESLGDTACHQARAYRAALDKAGVSWREVPRGQDLK